MKTSSLRSRGTAHPARITSTIRILATASALACAVHLPSAFAQAYPDRPIRLIVPFAPGGGSDIMARTLGARLAETWGQQVVVDNRSGGGTVIGTDLAARSTPDGYTILLANIAFALNPGLNSKLPYDAVKDFSPVILLASQPNALAVTNSLPVNSVKDLISLSKSKSTVLNFASSGNGGVGHISGEMFRLAINADMVHIPYKGGGPAVTDLIAGRVPMAFISLPTVMSHLKGGRLKVLAVSDSKRAGSAPDIPTISETIPGFEVDNWVGLLAPAGTARNVIDRINTDTLRLIRSADLKARLESHGFDMVGSTPEAFAKKISADIEKYRKVIRAANIRPQ